MTGGGAAMGGNTRQPSPVCCLYSGASTTMRNTGLRFLLPYMRPYNGMLLLGTLYAIIGAGASAFSPTLLGWAIDELNGGVRLQVLAIYALGILGLSCTLAVFRYLLRMLTGAIAAGVSYQMSQDMYARLLTFDKAALTQYGTGLMALTSPLLATVVVVMLAISVLAQVRLSRVLERSFDKVQQELAHLAAFAQEYLGAARMIAAYAQEQPAVTAFSRANDHYARRNLDFVLRSSAISPLPSLVVRLAATLILAIGGMLIIQGQLTLGEYVQFIIYLNLLSTAAQQLSQAYERLQQGSAAAGRIGEVLLRRPDIADAPDAIVLPLAGDLHFEGVGVRVQDRWVLRDIDLVVRAGTTLGIVGATGSGKSTLISLLGRVRDPDAGTVMLDGHDLRT